VLNADLARTFYGWGLECVRPDGLEVDMVPSCFIGFTGFEMKTRDSGSIYHVLGYEQLFRVPLLWAELSG